MTAQVRTPDARDAAVPTPARGTARRIAGIVFSVLLGMVCYFCAFFPVGQQAGISTHGPAAVLAFIQLVAMLPVCVLLGWRARWPYVVTALAAGISLAFPSTPLPALIGMSVLLRIRRGPWVWVLSAATVIGTAVSVIWDMRAAPAGLSLSLLIIHGGDWRGPPPWDVAWWLVPLWTVILVAPFAVTGILRRLRAERDRAVTERHVAVQDADTLHGEVSRHVERQELARELHDTLASRLSSLSLHANALELGADRDPELARAARAVRAAAQTSLEDLRHVVDVLRAPDGGRLPGRATLAEIGELLDDAHEAGDRVRSRLFVADASGCDPAVAHAAYRIVQESLSNARRHAPGTDVTVRVDGGPGTGLTIEVVNALPRQPPAAAGGGGHGLVGMRERAESLGGTFAAGPSANGVFTVTAWMPWVAGEPGATSMSEATP